MAIDQGDEDSSARAAGGLGLPAIAAKANNLEAIRQAVEDAAGVSAGLWLSYMFVFFYLGVAAAAVTHADLLLERPVKLPFLGIELPLLFFFFLAPLLFVITHAYTLVYFVLLANKAVLFHYELGRQIPDTPENPNAAEIRTALRRQLHSNIFIQFLAGPAEIRDSRFGLLLKFIAWTTLVVGPIALLLLLQIQFLPYHELWITWTHRSAILIDLLLIWWLWRKILGGRGDPRRWGAWTLWATIAAPLAVSFLFSWTVATIPGEWLDSHLPSLEVIPIFGQPAMNQRRVWHWTTLHRLVFSGIVDDTTRRRWSLSSNTLVLPGFDIYEALKIDDPKKVEWKPHIVSLRGRHLEGARLDGATLKRADLEGAFMEGASLAFAQLQGASLKAAHLEGASLAGAQLQGALLAGAQLQGASLAFAQLQGASLKAAHLEDASLDDAHLDERASLDDAHLERASLYDAHLERASLYDAHLQGALLAGAQLQGALLAGAQLQGASLAGAQLQGASLAGAQLQGASLNDAHLEGASLYGAHLEGASLAGAQLQGASLYGAQLQGASLYGAQLQGASLSGAQLQGASLVDADLEGTSLDGAFLWRAQLQTAKLIGLYAPILHWRPEYLDRDDSLHPWRETNEDYDALVQAIRSIPEISARIAAKLGILPTRNRDEALNRVAALDCNRTTDTLASCKPSIEPPAAVRNWRKAIESSRVDKPAHLKVLAETLDKLVCSGESDAIHVLRGLINSERIQATEREAPSLVTRFMHAACPVSAALTDADRAKLRSIARDTPPKENVGLPRGPE